MIIIDGVSITSFVFPAGEIQVRVKNDDNYEDISLWDRNQVIKLRATIVNSNNLMTLLLVVNSLKSMGFRRLALTLPYCPYARQDRIVNDGEALSIKVFAELINSCNFEEVNILDIHSNVGAALIDNYREMKNEWSSFIETVSNHLEYKCKFRESPAYILCPDAGAIKRAEKAAALMSCGVLVASKKRDGKTGSILGVRVPEIERGSNVLVIDDICDGGATFLALGKELRNRGVAGLFLAVSHGIFSKGLDELAALYDMIYCTDSFPHNQKHDKLYTFCLPQFNFAKE